MTIQDALLGYWLERRRNVSEATVKDYSLTFNRFVAWLPANIQIDAITADHVRQFLNAMQRQHKLRGKTLANYWTALSSLWTWAEAELNLPHVIRNRVACPEYRRPAILPYTRQEITAMLEATGQNSAWRSRNGHQVRSIRPEALRDRAIVLTLLDSGLRASELCALCVGDHEQRTGQLHIKKGKGNKARYVYLGDSSRKAIWRYLASRPGVQPGAPLFATKTGGHIERNSLGNMIESTAKRAGVAHPTIHRFRHTFAITFLRNGGNVLELQQLLGHEKLDTVRIYASLAQVDLVDAQRRASPADNWRL